MNVECHFSNVEKMEREYVNICILNANYNAEGLIEMIFDINQNIFFIFGNRAVSDTPLLSRVLLTTIPTVDKISLKLVIRLLNSCFISFQFNSWSRSCRYFFTPCCIFIQWYIVLIYWRSLYFLFWRFNRWWWNNNGLNIVY